MDPKQREYAGKVWQAIAKSKAFQQADHATKQKIRADWQDEHVKPYQTSGRSRMAEAPAAQRKEIAGPPEPPAWKPGPVGNFLLNAYSRMAAPQAAEAAGRPLLPPGMVTPLKGAADAAANIPAGAEQIVANVGAAMVPGLGALAGPVIKSVIAQPLLRAPGYANQVRQGQITPEDARRYMETDAASAAIMPALDKFLPGGTIGRTLMSEGAQSAAQAELDAMGKDIAPTAGGLLTDFGLGIGLRGASGGLRQEFNQAKQMGRNALETLQQPIPLGDASRQRGAIDFTPKRRPEQGIDLGAASDDQTIPRTAPEVVNRKQWFHGTGTVGLEPGKLSPDMTDIGGLFGPGIYLTDNLDIAKGYAGARGKKTGERAIYEAKVNVGRVLDLEQAAPPDVADILIRAVPEDYRSAVTAAAARPGATAEQIYQAMREDLTDYSHDAGISKAEISENFQDIAIALKQAGYDAYTHTGGKRTGRAAHQVLIMLDPNDAYIDTGRSGQVSKFQQNPVLTGGKSPEATPVQPDNRQIPQQPSPEEVAAKEKDDRIAWVERERRRLRDYLTERGSDMHPNSRESIKARIRELAHEQDVLEGRSTGPAQPQAQPAAAGGGQQPPNAPPPAAAAPAPVPPPQPVQPPTPRQVTPPADPTPADPFAPTPPTPAMQRVYGDDVANLRGDARAEAKATAADMDTGPARGTATQDQVDAINPDEFMNFRRMGVQGTAEQRLRRLTQETVAEDGWVKGKRTRADLEAVAESYSPEMVRSLPDNVPPEWELIPDGLMKRARNEVKTLNAEAHKLSEDLKQGTYTPEERANIEAQIDVLENDAKQLLSVIVPQRTARGRSLAFLASQAEESMSPDYWLLRAKRIAGDLSPDQETEIIRLTRAGQAAVDSGDAAAVRDARIQLSKHFADLEKTNPVDAFMGGVRAALLSGIRTVSTNVVSNTLHQGALEVTKLPGALHDWVLSAATGQRTLGAPEGKGVLRAIKQGAVKGGQEFVQMMRQGATDEALAKYELPRELNTGLKWYDAGVNFILRLQGASDRPFYHYAYRRSIEDAAAMVARNEAEAKIKDLSLARADARDWIETRRQAIVEKPPEWLDNMAASEALYATFNNDNAISDFISGGKQRVKMRNPGLKGAAKAAVVDMNLPFTKIPSNMAVLQVGDLTGLSYAAKLAEQRGVRIKDAMKAEKGQRWKALTKPLSFEEQRELSRLFGMGATGLAATGLGMALAARGLATGLSSKEEQGRRGRDQVANVPEGAVKIGGRWRQLSRLAPWGNQVILGATLFEQGTREMTDASKRLPNMAAASLRTVKEMPVMTGVQNVYEAIDDPSSGMDRYAAGIGRMLVPTMVSDVAQAFDDRQRQAKGFVQGVQSRIPGLRNKLPEKVDPFGRPVKPPSVADILYSRDETSDPHVQELRRVEADITKVPDKMTVKVKGPDGEQTKQRVRLTQDEHNALQRIAGDTMLERLPKLMEGSKYREANDSNRAKLIEEAWAEARQKARDAYLKQNKDALVKRALEMQEAAGSSFFDNFIPTDEQGASGAGMFR